MDREAALAETSRSLASLRRHWIGYVVPVQHHLVCWMALLVMCERNKSEPHLALTQCGARSNALASKARSLERAPHFCSRSLLISDMNLVWSADRSWYSYQGNLAADMSLPGLCHS